MSKPKLYVLFDGRCGLCRRAAGWLQYEPAFIELDCIPFPSVLAMNRFPELFSAGVPEEVIVVDERGGVYKGSDGWIMCLYALQRWRELSFTLGQARWRPVVRAAIDLLSRNRFRLSKLLHLEGLAKEGGLGTC